MWFPSLRVSGSLRMSTGRVKEVGADNATQKRSGCLLATINASTSFMAVGTIQIL